jgi:hypothetical protein
MKNNYINFENSEKLVELGYTEECEYHFIGNKENNQIIQSDKINVGPPCPSILDVIDWIDTHYHVKIDLVFQSAIGSYKYQIWTPKKDDWKCERGFCVHSFFDKNQRNNAAIKHAIDVIKEEKIQKCTI